VFLYLSGLILILIFCKFLLTVAFHYNISKYLSLIKWQWLRPNSFRYALFSRHVLMKFILTYLIPHTLRNMLNCPDTVASAKRSFIKLKIIKTFNKFHMIDSRLSWLAVLSIEASCVRSLDLDDVIKAFACQKARSQPFWYYFIMWHCLWYFHRDCCVIFFMCGTVPL